MTKRPSYFVEFDNNYLIMQIKKDSEDSNTYSWEIEIFEKVDEGNKYRLHKETIKETSFVISLGRSILDKYFEVLEFVNPDYTDVDEGSNRVFFVCRRKNN